MASNGVTLTLDMVVADAVADAQGPAYKPLFRFHLVRTHVYFLVQGPIQITVGQELPAFCDSQTQVSGPFPPVLALWRRRRSG